MGQYASHVLVIQSHNTILDSPHQVILGPECIIGVLRDYKSWWNGKVDVYKAAKIRTFAPDSRRICRILGVQIYSQIVLRHACRIFG